MPSALETRYDAQYSPLLTSFLRDVEVQDVAGLPEPHFPLFGSSYETAKPKVVFVGRDTRGWGNMAEFLADAKQDARRALHRHQLAFESLEFTNWTNKFGSSFLDTVLKILARLHSIDDWKQLKRRYFPEVLRSFVWANTNSVEITPGAAATYSTWKVVKQASAAHFDRLDILLDVFAPDIVIIMYWGVGEAYLGRNVKWEPLGDHVQCGRCSGYTERIFKTAHPTWLSHQKLQAKVIEIITTECLTKGSTSDNE
jgi:hypothetical protein